MTNNFKKFFDLLEFYKKNIPTRYYKEETRFHFSSYDADDDKVISFTYEESYHCGDSDYWTIHIPIDILHNKKAVEKYVGEERARIAAAAEKEKKRIAAKKKRRDRATIKKYGLK